MRSTLDFISGRKTCIFVMSVTGLIDGPRNRLNQKDVTVMTSATIEMPTATRLSVNDFLSASRHLKVNAN